MWAIREALEAPGEARGGLGGASGTLGEVLGALVGGYGDFLGCLGRSWELLGVP